MYYERFTDRARKVLEQFAPREAKRLNHQYVGTEHILLALVAERFGVAARVLKNRGVDLGNLRNEVWEWEPALPEDDRIRGRLPFSPDAKMVVLYAMEECRTLGQRKVTTEHLLLGLAFQREGLHARLFAGLGLNPEDIRQEVLSRLRKNRK
jgi:ATP-dependent Clp protease ATP-binding subunit ClpC